MNDSSDELLFKIIKTRRVHAVVVFVLLIALFVVVWIFQYSNISGSFALKVTICIIALPLGYFVYSYVNSAFKVHCPKCNELVEQGRLPGEPIPSFCKKCGLSINKL